MVSFTTNNAYNNFYQFIWMTFEGDTRRNIRIPRLDIEINKIPAQILKKANEYSALTIAM